MLKTDDFSQKLWDAMWGVGLGSGKIKNIIRDICHPQNERIHTLDTSKLSQLGAKTQLLLDLFGMRSKLFWDGTEAGALGKHIAI